MRRPRTGPAHPPSDEETALRVEPPPSHAAGPRAIAASLRHAVGEMGVRRAASTLARVNQQQGFDCMGCAWPDPSARHHAEFCENGAKAVSEEATLRRADESLFAQWSLAQLAEQSDFWLGKRGRLTHPMHRAAGADRYRPISWPDAYELIARELNGLASPHEAAFYTSGRASNEAAFALQAFVRAFGTNNLPDCSNMCHESSGVALEQAIGVGKGSVSLDDIEHAGLLVVAGQNPGTNHPRMLTALERAKRRGATIVSINPLREPGLVRFKNPQRARGIVGRGSPLADKHLQIRLNGDLALFQAVNLLLIEMGAIDRAFVDARCVGFEALQAHLLELDWDDVLEATGLSWRQIDDFARLAAASERTIVCWAMGLTQHRNAVATIGEVANFLLLRGMIGRPGAGLCPVRGHSNVQGDRTMGITERPGEPFLDRLEQTLGAPMPREHGVDVVGAIRGMLAGRIKVFCALGGNFLSASPDTAATRRALESCRLTVHVATKLNRSHLTCGREALLLPTLGRTERDVRRGRLQVTTVEDSMSVVRSSRGHLPPSSPHLRSEPAIVCEIAATVLEDRLPVAWLEWADDYDKIRDAIAAAIPGFEGFNERRDDGFVLPHPPRDELRFPTPSGRAHLSVNELEILRVPPGRLLLQTLRSHDQFNTTIYGLNDRYRGVKGGRRVVLVNPADLASLGLQIGELVDIVGEPEDGNERRVARFRTVAFDTPSGCIAAYYPETNPLVPLGSVATGSGTPTSKSIVVRLERAADAN
jgi:molybdopterin-dependent oxidoreductase alpha subunit